MPPTPIDAIADAFFGAIIRQDADALDQYFDASHLRDEPIYHVLEHRP
jgi:hypothetical protein